MKYLMASIGLALVCANIMLATYMVMELWDAHSWGLITVVIGVLILSLAGLIHAIFNLLLNDYER